MSSQYTDLSGIFYIQQQYLTDLSAISTGTTVSQYIPQLQASLDSAYKSFSDANTSSSYVLDHQTKMNAIIQNENNRLLTKKDNVDSAVLGQHRIAMFNDSFRKKNMQYINILIIIIVALVLYLALTMIKNTFTIIPSFFVNFIIALVFSTALIMILLIGIDMNKRDPMDFDKLNTISLGGNTVVQGNTVVSDSSSTSLSGMNYCIGDSCCSSGTTWDSTQGLCVIGNVVTSGSEGFSLSPMKYNGNLDLDINKSASAFLPYVPFEFEAYGKI